MNQNFVFVNCPFDNHYFPLLKSLLFTLIYIEFEPRISETTDSGQVRLNKIYKLMFDSKYSIHDLSRMEPLILNDLPRFNMPFECGIDFGIRMSGDQDIVNKQFLILEKEQHRYKQVISDISGNDIKAHHNSAELVIKVTRDWFKPNHPNIPWYKEIWLAFNEFSYDYEKVLEDSGYDSKDINAMTFTDIIEYMKAWINEYKGIMS
ncbi:MAG: hypothetical protein ACOYPR_13235 [Saprospiraceae bacterium]